MATVASYWCYRCSRFVRVWTRDLVVCPDCDGGFLEVVEAAPPLRPSAAEPRHRRYPSSAMYLMSEGAAASRQRCPRRGDRSPFNPVIVLRGTGDGGGDADRAAGSAFELYYDDGEGSGLRPLPSVSDFLMGSGFDRFLDQLSQIEIGPRGFKQPPASKAAIESMPTIEIAAAHITSDSHCAVCKDVASISITKTASSPGSPSATRAPCAATSCQLIRCSHKDWTVKSKLSLLEMMRTPPSPVGLTIWRLPGGGFAVGRFSGGRQPVERELPVVYTEMDGGFNTSGASRRISWSSRGSQSRESGGIGREFRNFFSLFSGRLRLSSTNPRSNLESRSSTSHTSRRSSAGEVESREGWPEK